MKSHWHNLWPCQLRAPSLLSCLSLSRVPSRPFSCCASWPAPGPGTRPEWERLYRSILANKPAGSVFEDSILKAASLEKNTALMLPPPGSQAVGFIPDSVRGNPGELLWGQPYRFVEAKGRQELALTGNLKAMLEYVQKYGGHIELWVRSARHPAGQTRLTAPLQRDLGDLIRDGNAAISYSP